MLYNNSLLCYQQIKANPSQYVMLSFSLLKIESDPHCTKDFVEVGTRHLKQLQNSCHVICHNNVHKRTAMTICECNADCDIKCADLNYLQKFIIGPNYLQKLNSFVKIYQPLIYQAALKSANRYVVSSKTNQNLPTFIWNILCRNSQLTDVLTQVVSTYCGDMDPFTWISDGNEVVIKFHTDAENRYQGYRATFRALEKEPFSSKWREFASLQ